MKMDSMEILFMIKIENLRFKNPGFWYKLFLIGRLKHCFRLKGNTDVFVAMTSHQWDMCSVNTRLKRRIIFCK